MAHSKTVSDVVNDTLSTPAKPAASKTAGYAAFEPQAMKALLESAVEKAADKIARRKRGGRELAEFARIISAALAAELPLPSAVKAALKMAMAVGNGEDSLSWIIQKLMGDFFWTFRRMSTLRTRRAWPVPRLLTYRRLRPVTRPDVRRETAESASGGTSRRSRPSTAGRSS